MSILQRYQHLLPRRTAIAVFLAAAMIGGFMTGRAILSLAMALFGLNALWGTHPRKWFGQRWWLLGLAWVGVYALSWFWSSDLAYWNERLQVKLPVLLLPLAFAFLPKFSAKDLIRFTNIVALFIFSGCMYSLYFLWHDPKGIFDGYFTSKVMPTPAYHDHIRYSILVAWFVIWCCRVYPLAQHKAYRIFLVIAMSFFAVYLHILAVKSGLMILYLFVLLSAGRMLFSRKPLHAVGVLLILGIGIFVAFKKVPSFKYKTNYLKYTYEEYQRKGMSGQFSDMGRIISYQVATKVFADHPWIGVGAGDILDEMSLAYHKYYPNEQRPLVPHNQLIVVMLAGGILALVPFVWWLLYPLSKIPRGREGYFTFVCWAVLLAAMVVEPMLEIQFGVFIYLFCLLWTWKCQELADDHSSSSNSGRLSSR